MPTQGLTPTSRAQDDAARWAAAGARVWSLGPLLIVLSIVPWLVLGTARDLWFPLAVAWLLVAATTVAVAGGAGAFTPYSDRRWRAVLSAALLVVACVGQLLASLHTRGNLQAVLLAVLAVLGLVGAVGLDQGVVPDRERFTPLLLPLLASVLMVAGPLLSIGVRAAVDRQDDRARVSDRASDLILSSGIGVGYLPQVPGFRLDEAYLQSDGVYLTYERGDETSYSAGEPTVGVLITRATSGCAALGSPPDCDDGGSDDGDRTDEPGEPGEVAIARDAGEYLVLQSTGVDVSRVVSALTHTDAVPVDDLAGIVRSTD